MSRTVALALLLMVFSSPIFAGESLLVLTESDADSLIQLETDTVAVIELPANFSTGHSWQFASFPAEELQFLGSEYSYEETDRLGGWGTQRIFIAGAAEALVPVRLLYKRFHDAAFQESRTFYVQSQGVYLGDFYLPPPAPVPAMQKYTSGSLGLPGQFNWCEQGGCTPVKNQGSCGSCWAFATVGPFESNIKIKDGVTEDLSEQYLVSCNSEGWGCNGGWWGHDYHLSKMVSGETEAGAALESVFPYQALDVACNPPHPKAYQLDDWNYVVDQSSVPSVDQMKQAIFDHGPLAVAVCVDSAFQSYSGGVFTGPGCSGVNHGVVLVGWNDSDGAWIMKNSWGTGWGESGYMRIAYGVSQIGYAASYVTYGGGSLNANFEFSAYELSVVFTDKSKPSPGGSIVAWSWDFGDGQTSGDQNPAHSYAQEGTYTVTLTVTDDQSASDTVSREVTVPPVLVYCDSRSQTCNEEWIAQVDIGGFSNQSGAQNYSDFTSKVIALEMEQAYPVAITPGFSGSAYTEYFGILVDLNQDGDFDDSGELVFSQSGSSAVSGSLVIPTTAVIGVTRLRVSMKYGSTAGPCEIFTYGEVEDYTLNIEGPGIPPTAFFSFGVSGLDVTFTDQSTDSDGTLVGWAWDFGDGHTSGVQHPAHTYAAAGTYTVQLTVLDDSGLSDTAVEEVTVLGWPPQASFGFTVSGRNVAFADSSADPDGTVVGWTWDFGDGHTSDAQHPTHGYVSAGTYTVTLTVVDDSGLSGTASQTVTLSDFAYCASNSKYCNEEWIARVDIGGFSNQSGAQVYSDFTSMTIALSRGQSIAVNLVPAFSGSTYTEYFRVFVDFNQDGDFDDSGEQVFSKSGKSAVGGAFSVPAAAVPGITRMRVSMKYGSAAGSCEVYTWGEVEDYTVIIGEPVLPPQASFGYGVSGRSVAFSDQSADPDGTVVGWAWDFGDGQTSAVQHPTHTYAAAGTYTVTLTVVDDSGLSGTASQEVTVGDAAYCASGSNYSDEEWIARVEIGAFSNSSGGQNYSDFTSQVIALQPGQTYSTNLSPAYSGNLYTEYFRIFIDLNQDGDFDDSGEQVFTQSGKSAVSGTFTVPASTAPGATRLRVSMKYGSAAGPCETFTYGEVEDYTAHIGAAGLSGIPVKPAL